MAMRTNSRPLVLRGSGHDSGPSQGPLSCYPEPELLHLKTKTVRVLLLRAVRRQCVESCNALGTMPGTQ